MTISQPPTGRASSYSKPNTQPRHTTLRRIETLATRLRDGFDYFSGSAPRPGGKKLKWSSNPLVVVGVLGGIALLAGVFVTAGLTGACSISLMRLEVTFSASRFAELLGALPAMCRPRVAASFGRDVLACIAYPFALSALYMWTERWRRFEPQVDGDDARVDRELPLRNHVIVVAPFLAAALDLVLENLTLWRATQIIQFDPVRIPPSASWLVWIGSAAAALKWTFLFVIGLALVAELLSGPRGVILRRLRFSALAVALGALPLLATAPGQDILQRVAEGDHRVGQTILGVLAIAFAATAVWYCGRKLVQLEFEGVSANFDELSPAQHLERDLRWRVKPWYTYFAEHLPRLMGIVVLVIAGAAFARAGIALGWFGGVAFVSVAFVIAVELVARRRHPRPEQPTEEWRAEDARRAFRRRALESMIGVAIGAGMLLPFGVRLFGGGKLDEATRQRAYLCWASWACVAAAWGLYFWVYHRREIGAGAAVPRATREREATGGIDAREIPRDVKVKSAFAVVASTVLLFLFAASPVSVGRSLGPLSVLAIFIANMVFFGSVMVWIFARYHVPIVRIGLGLGVVFSFWNENHDVRSVVDRPAGLIDRRPTLEAHYAQWLAARRKTDAGPVPMVLVAAAGGGLRASYWTAASLAVAQDRDSTFARHVFAISGVSGGSLGGAVFAALARDAAGRADTLPCARGATRDTSMSANLPSAYTRCVRRFMGEDFLSPVLSMMVAPDLTQRFLPFPIQWFDRSRGLEEAWVRSYHTATGDSTFARGLLELTSDSASEVNVPALFLNSTHVESGRRYIAANVKTSPGVLDQQDVIALLESDLPLAGAVHNSARFTYVSPAGHLDLHDGREYGHVVDGGYFENSGLATVGNILQALGMATTRDSSVRPVVLYLCNDPLPCVAESAGSLGTTTRSTSVNETLAPLRAVLAARGARGSLARAEIMKVPGVTYLQLNVCDSLVTGTPATGADSSKKVRQRERVVSPPLSWLLSGLARDWMDSSLTAGPSPSGNSCRAQNARNLETLHRLLHP